MLPDRLALLLLVHISLFFHTSFISIIYHLVFSFVLGLMRGRMIFGGVGSVTNGTKYE